MPRAQTTAFIFSQFTTRGAVHYMGLPEQVLMKLDLNHFNLYILICHTCILKDYFGSQPEPTFRETSHLKDSIDEAKKYTFNVPEECVENDDTHSIASRVEQVRSSWHF